MKKTPAKLLALLTALALSVSMTGAALAAPSTDHITIKTPKNKAVYYIGESIPLSAALKRHVVDKYATLTTFELALANTKSDKTVWSQELGDSFISSPDGDIEEHPIPWPSSGSPYQFSKKVKTSKLAAGSYTFEIAFFGRLTEEAAEIADESDDYSGNYRISEDASVNLTLKKLKAPTKLKASAGKRKVTLSWKKAEGAKKYEIYRSTKKKSGYKRIAATTKTKYVNKKLKKGKRYYYKVRTLRGSVKSAFTGQVRSGKVK